MEWRMEVKEVREEEKEGSNEGKKAGRAVLSMKEQEESCKRCGRGGHEVLCKYSQHCRLSNVRSCDGSPVLRHREPWSSTHFEL